MNKVSDIDFMKIALAEAKKAYNLGEVPVGAVLCDENDLVLSKAHNQTENDFFAGSHAELIAIREASKIKQNWRLNNCTLYVTLEPCPMCISLCVLSRIKRIVFGAIDERMGACGSLFNLAEHPMLPSQIKIESGVLEDECKEILKFFFKEVRNRKT